MPTHLECVVFDAAQPATIARFWSTVTGWPVTYEDPTEVVVAPEAGAPGVSLVFIAVPEAKQGKNRVHLDLASASTDEQHDTVERLLDAGARHMDIGQRDVPWTVLADPEGNEFCVLEPRVAYSGTGPIAAVVVEAIEPAAQAGFWSAAAGWPVVAKEDRFSALRESEGTGPYLEFVATAAAKARKNRVHTDIAPWPGQDQATEVSRLHKLGATPADVGQRDVSWVVLADPEGNEFCVLTPR